MRALISRDTVLSMTFSQTVTFLKILFPYINLHFIKVKFEIFAGLLLDQSHQARHELSLECQLGKGVSKYIIEIQNNFLE